MHPQSFQTAFNPSVPGTPELCWKTALAHAPTIELPEVELLVVSPHPDDETLGAGGLIHAAATRMHSVTVLSVTDGESAYPDWKDLKEVRRREADFALSILSSYHVRVERLAIPDGRVATHRSLLRQAIDEMVSPTTLLIAPYELDGHPDHEATGAVCLEIARRRQLTIWRYPIWAWHHSPPERFRHQRWGRLLLDVETRRVKKRAIECFASQLRPLAREAIIPRHVVPYFLRPYEAFCL